MKGEYIAIFALVAVIIAGGAWYFATRREATAAPQPLPQTIPESNTGRGQSRSAVAEAVGIASAVASAIQAAGGIDIEI